jgi:hypothetical protein
MHADQARVLADSVPEFAQAAHRITRNRVCLFHEDTHSQAPDQPPRPGLILTPDPVPGPSSDNTESLAQSSRNSYQTAPWLGFDGEGALPFMRLDCATSEASKESLEIAHGYRFPSAPSPIRLFGT